MRNSTFGELSRLNLAVEFAGMTKARAVHAGVGSPGHRSWDEWAIVPPLLASTMHFMKRIVAAPLWFFVGWFAGSAVALTFGLGAFLAPMTAVVLAGLVVAIPWCHLECPAT